MGEAWAAHVSAKLDCFKATMFSVASETNFGAEPPMGSRNQSVSVLPE